MNKILFPTDFSPCASNAFDYANALARKLKATIDLISIFNLPVSDASSVPPDYIQEMLDDKKARIQEQLESFSEQHPSPRIGEKIAEYGVFVYQEVADKAEDQGYDLIVMGTKGEHNTIEKLMGSVTSQMILHASCPVLAVPEHAKFQPIRKIAFATDFFAEEKEAIGSLQVVADAFSADIEYVHIDTSGEAKDLKAEEESIKAKYSFPNFTLVQHKNLYQGMEEYLESNEVDILALFIPRRKLFERLFHNSFSRKMAFHSNIPLLTFR